MSSVGSLSTSTSTSIRGYGGLASGLDRDELIKGMTLGTTSKINKQEQKKQQIQWKQEAIQSISDKMIDFHSKYTETLTSPTNLFSSLLWGRNKITTSGANSKYVSVTGTASGADAITIMGIKQKAEDAKWSSSNKVSSGELSTGKFAADMATKTYEVENLVGKTIEFKYGSSNYSIYLSDSDEYDYKSAKGIADAVNDLLKKQSINDDKKLFDIIEAVGNENGTFTFKSKSGGNALELTGGTALSYLGLRNNPVGDEKEGKIVNDGKFIEKQSELSGTVSDNITENVNFFKYVEGKSLTFSYNGTSTTVKMPGAADLEAAAKAFGTDANGKATNKATIKAIASSIQDQLDKAFGKDRIKVNGDGGELSFTTTIPGSNGGKDDSSVLTLTGGSLALIGDEKGALQKAGGSKQSVLHAGDTTRLNLKNNINAADLEGLRKVVRNDNGNEKRGFMLNDTFIEVGENATYNDLIKAINDSDANVTVTYQEAADKFTFTSKEKGASGVINFSNAANTDDTLEALDNVFGLGLFTDKKNDSGKNIVEIKIDNNPAEQFTERVDENGNTIYTQNSGKKYTLKDGELLDDNNQKVENAVIKNVKERTSSPLSVRGQDAIVSVKYAGSDEIVNLRRDSNSFTVDGLTIGVKGTFGEYKKDAAGNLTDELDKEKIEPDQAVEIDASVDVDKVYDTIKSFVESYNAIVETVNKQLTTKHEKDYDPLTSEQKGELSDDEIEKWEEKAKEGLLYGDSDLRSLSMDLRVVVSGGLLEKFKAIGINVSSTYSDNGKLSIDESKLRGALQTDPESVQKLFTSEAGVDADGNQTFNGLATNLKKVMDKYVKTMGSMDTKGILIRKAGSKSSALSLTQNTYYDQMKSIDKLLESLKARLKKEQDRYVSQFSTLETLIANMNSQSSYLSSMSGY